MAMHLLVGSMAFSFEKILLHEGKAGTRAARTPSHFKKSMGGRHTSLNFKIQCHFQYDTIKTYTILVRIKFH